MYRGGVNILSFATAGSEALHIDSSGNVNITNDIDVDGHTNLDNVSISGVTTATGNITISSAHPKLLLTDDTNPDFSVHVNATAFHIRNETDNRNEFRILSDGTTELHYAGTKKFETGNTVNTNSNHFEITSGQQLRFDNSNDNRSSEILNTGSSGNSTLAFKTNGGTRWTIDSDGHLLPETAGAVNIGSASVGIGSVFLPDDKKISLGNDEDLQIVHSSGNVSLITSPTSRQLQFKSDGGFLIRGTGNQMIANFVQSAVTLYHSQTIRLTTTSTGITVGGEVAASQDYPNFRPTLDLNFAAEKKLDPRITYQRTGPASFVNEFGKVVLVGDNVPRFDHDPVTRESKGLLIEESRTNLFASSDPSNSVWILDGSMTRTANTTDTKDPAGTYTATKLMSAASANSTSQIYDGLSHGSGGVQSLWAKKGTHNVLGIFDYGGGSGVRGWFDLNTGEHRCEGGSKVAAGVQSSGNDSNTTNMIEYPNGWYRCIYYEAANMTYAHFRIVDFDADNEASASSNSIYVWGLQAEGSGVLFATSHIPCDTGVMPGTITRGADFVKVEDEEFAEFYNDAVEHTTVMVGQRVGNSGGGDGRLYSISDGTASQVAPDWDFDDGTKLRLSTNVGGSSQMVQTISSWSGIDDEFKIAAGMAVNNQIGVVNGTAIASADTSCLMPTGVDRLYFGLRGNEGNQGSLTIKRFMFYPKRLPDSQLVTLTS